MMKGDKDMEELFSLYEVRACILESEDLGRALRVLDEALANYSSLHTDERLEDIRMDYSRMKDFVLRGFRDHQRETLYRQLLRRLFVVVNDIILQSYLHHKTSYMTAALKCRNMSICNDDIKMRLEGFVQDVAMLSLTPDEQRRQQIYQEHFDWLSRLFDAILISPQWKESQFSFWADILVSPTIDASDASLLTSAIMLSCINIFDVEKFHLLVHIALVSHDETLRQRAMAGMALSLDNGCDCSPLYPEMQEWIDAFTADESRCRQLLEMQMQVVYCFDVDKDTATIRKDIMPGIIKNQNFTFDRNGIHEKEEDSLEDILHGDDFDRRMDEMEKSMKRIRDMQKNGSDIYFGGFSHMKRFAFFYVLSNWFAPFTADHPGLAEASAKLPGGRQLIERISAVSPFCDSDAYSFAFALSSVINQLPESVREMMKNADAMLGPEQPEGMRTQPAYIRLMYLQSLYRFFRLYIHKDDFSNPFDYDSDKRRFFFIHPLLRHTPLRLLAVRLEQFMVKRHRFDLLGDIVDHYAEEPLTLGERRMKALWLEKQGKIDEAADNYQRILKEYPDDKAALAKVAWIDMERGNYTEAAGHYRRLCLLKPDDVAYQIRWGICLLWTNKSDEGLQKLYELDFRYPDNTDVRRALAWGLLLQGKAKKAEETYDRLLSSGQDESQDWLNAAYSKWFQGKVSDAVILFKNYKAKENHDIRKAFENDSQLFLIYGVTSCDIHIMLDLIDE